MIKKAFVFIVVATLLSAFAGTLYYLYSKSDEPPELFGTAAPVLKTIVKKTVATGSVVPRREVDIKPQVSGIVGEIFVEPGQTVGRGDLIARIEIIPNMVSLNNAENRVNRARISMENARLELERNARLRDDGIIAKSEFEQVELAHANSREELSAALDNLALIRKGSTESRGQQSNTLVRATIGGMVLEVPLEIGDSVIESNTFNDGTTIATVADMDELIFLGKVDESEVGKLRPGMELLLTIGAIEEKQFRAELEHIAPKGSEENGAIQFEIRAALQLRDDVFVRANYSANADIVLDRRDEVLALDEGLLQFDGDIAYVEVETAPQTFERREIETGLSDGLAIEIVSGLSPQDRVKDPNTQRAAGGA